MIVIFSKNSSFVQTLTHLVGRFVDKDKIQLIDDVKAFDLSGVDLALVDDIERSSWDKEFTRSGLSFPVFYVPQKQMRPSKLMAHVTALLSGGEKKNYASDIPLGRYIFNQADFLLIHHDTKDEIILTEKERDILLFIYDQKGKAVTRQDLLDRVWGYGSNIETHTLETHVYRLRQKIESDPSKPTFLVTDDEGYRLNL